MKTSYSNDEIRARLALAGVVTMGDPLPRRGLRCGHVDEDLRSAIVELPELFVCRLCGDWWRARDRQGRYLLPPRVCFACGARVNVGRVLCLVHWLRVPAALRAKMQKDLQRARGMLLRDVASVREAVRLVVAELLDA